MRPVIVVLVALALGIATITAVLFNQVLSHRAAPVPVATVAAPPPDSVEIVVAAHDVKMGETVASSDVRYVYWPSAAVDSRYVRRAAHKDVRNDFAGTIARRHLFAGEPLTQDTVFRRDKAGVMAGVLSPGMRAVSIPVTAVSGVAGFVLPEDHVDVLLSQDIHAATGQASDHPRHGDMLRYAEETVLADVRVLAVDEKMAAPDKAASQAGKTVTVEVAPRDAEKLVLAHRMGELVLALHSVSPDPAPSVATNYIGDVKASSALKAVLGPGSVSSMGTVLVNRGGAVTTQYFTF